jgi:hypothetical protein
MLGVGGCNVDVVPQVDRASLAGLEFIGESDQFVIYAEGRDTYFLVQRHEGTPWTGVRISGDALFRVGSLITDGMRHLYRDLATLVRK